jgi:hypothetical protein
LNNALNVFDGASYEGRSYDAIGDLDALLCAGLGLEVEERQVDVSLEVRTEPWFEVGALGCEMG